MASYREIVTKAVIGKGKKEYRNNYTVNTDNIVNTVLGCWIINNKFEGEFDNDNVVINGSFDVNIWYSYDNDTKTTVITKPISYKELVNINLKNSSNTEVKDIIVRCLKQPTCINAKENGKVIDIEIEKELGVEIVGDTKVRIATLEEEESWDNLDEEYNKDIEKEIDSTVKEDYIN